MSTLVRLDSLGHHRVCCRRRATAGAILGIVGLASTLVWGGVEPWVAGVAWIPGIALSLLWWRGFVKARSLLGRWAWGCAAIGVVEVMRRASEEPPLANRGSVWIELGIVLLVFLIWKGIGSHRHSTWDH
jgi:hypothetical protein